MILIKNFKLVVLIISISLLTACSSNSKLISVEKNPAYKINNEERRSVTDTPFLKAIITPNQQKNPNQSSESQSAASVNSVNSIEQEGRRVVTVTSIVDGDTIKYSDPNLGGKTVTARLIGINAPEYTKEKQIYGKEATDYLSNLILGKQIEIERDSNADLTDRYGRYLIHAFIGGKSVQYMLLAEGLVRVAYLYNDYKYTDLFQKAQNIAKNSKLNIWSIPGYVDKKSGFNMEVIKNSVKAEVQTKLRDLINNVK